MTSDQEDRRLRPGDQPLPVPNGHPDVQSMVIADIGQRRELGIRRYGTALQPFNGRDGLRDLYEELLDACQYVRQVIFERDAGEPKPSEALAPDPADVAADLDAAELGRHLREHHAMLSVEAFAAVRAMIAQVREQAAADERARIRDGLNDLGKRDQRFIYFGRAVAAVLDGDS